MHKILENVLIFVSIFIIFKLKTITDNFRENNFLKNHYKDSINNVEIYDLGFKYIPYHSNNIIDDILVMCPVLLLILHTPNAKDYLIVLFSIFIIRQICTILTILPPVPQCQENLERRFRNDISKNIDEYLLLSSCSETVFSGHAVLLLVTILFLIPKLPNYAKIIAYIYAIFTSIVIIAVRHHYTIDVFLSWVICITFYIAYFGKGVIKTLMPF